MLLRFCFVNRAVSRNFALKSILVFSFEVMMLLYNLKT